MATVSFNPVQAASTMFLRVTAPPVVHSMLVSEKSQTTISDALLDSDQHPTLIAPVSAPERDDPPDLLIFDAISQTRKYVAPHVPVTQTILGTEVNGIVHNQMGTLTHFRKST
ncbi:hypothetical protein NHX12_017241 [Muraenolepis orangiensis]|uniref:Uncharacterized protein n=1 Tax=Muraenolepis orangiensis TaxID=630683 RepID=A0A9Q0I1T1_9TELE|nr:hypothetical protein NHX12_017247 [Muraenolepis orangiensis]KAJ3583482.1 hypothetical protein NHX12_017241 [Muraenolepis orangiensis]